jgi:hypothetical protein
MPDLTVRQLLAAGGCSSRCLTASGSETAQCACPCGGRWHALLAGLVVAGSGALVAPRRPEPTVSGQLDLFAETAAPV